MTDYLQYPNVVGYGRGLRTRGVEQTLEPATVVLVREKLPKLMLRPDEVLPPEVDVVQVGEIRALRTTKHRPAPGGVSIGHFAITAGTLGTRVFDGDQRLILSNNHVLANSNEAVAGDEIYQPGPHDGGTASDFIAVLDRFIPINFGGGTSLAGLLASIGNALLAMFGDPCRLVTDCPEGGENLVDAAVALPINDADLSDIILEIGPVSGSIQATLQMPVRKSGRTTGLTTGVVQVLDAVVQVQYGGGRVATFSEQIITSAMSEGGDSGSLLVHGEENAAVGLLFAGSSEVTIFNPIDRVLSLLGVQL